MIEQFLQTALGFFKEIWFQLNSRFDLENTEAFNLLKPYLIQLQDNPLYMGISIAALFLVPYTLIKVRSISKEREHKLDELMEEMEEEEFDEDDPRRLRRPETKLDNNDEDETDKPLFGAGEADSSSHEIVLDEDESIISEEDLEAELDEFELEPSIEGEETSNSEVNEEPISSLLAESEFDKELNEFMAEDLDLNEKDKDVISELNIDDTSHDQAIKELQEEGELTELEEEDELPANDPFANYSELDEDEQDKAIKDLQDEMERTINQLTQQIEEPDEIPNPMKDMSQIHIGGNATIDEEYSSDVEEEEYFLEDTPPVPESGSPEESAASSESISELSDSEILASLEPELETQGMEAKSELEIPDTRDYEPEASSESFTFEPESDIPANEPVITSENFTFEPESIQSEDSTERSAYSMESEDEPSSPEKADSLIDRLKFLQTRFENRYQPLEPISSPVDKKIPDYAPESLAEPRRYTRTSASVPPDSKKYMDLLESFIFMKDQKKHK
ncbi:MAG: hypothetical protein HN472_13630 [Nitrospina sp.]|jgi:Tfp pilus assembly protein PilO|nr:hypothetical protein [Nitrospina sp.]MBT3874528.1 hypothetical protein [Nitrospina sp.]MBT4049869.1 hypothetical protein [Nitrospina sp.]MBT4557865.1 hypothetical protein [Nitrospina sp.]MBT5347997.1 hypothetical protein [Nitrospina sp.]